MEAGEDDNKDEDNAKDKDDNEEGSTVLLKVLVKKLMNIVISDNEDKDKCEDQQQQLSKHPRTEPLQHSQSPSKRIQSSTPAQTPGIGVGSLIDSESPTLLRKS